ncbi:MAG: glycosyltransferase [Candidatus Jettenia sp.]|uniref:Glycosyltransferase 2-like domain-containing protein n=1 Tax=Candidatus Jettenia caeni TaxID=247490 RepID=I3INU1_9BACT|nr:glycosyltransferase family 2 protein [Candidatus Jettenia sp. AMX1]MBC6927537.1 glycosyltransferase [Candidatus Jettenia sp.]NUN23929.1 glycosyltransferase [Candidatus Jettenia caeni]KAA0251515.1 MAG: glycosyltransferase [Candidatus Jettenia sp. AMX1]MCE7881347.1 glycosyltransferase [Candidatus Jettenia sp. AMX1]MCQ3926065.1 glycosyltransferase [Candidatus Jettenia sp.]
MKISVIIPTFNSARTIEDTLKSIFNQNWPDFQIIIQDGKSTDDTETIVARYPTAMAGWQSEPDNGIYDAMNKGIRRATGDIIAILNSDDVWLPGTLERINSVFLRNPDIGIVSGSIEVWEDSPGGAKVVLKSSLLHSRKSMAIQHPATFVRRNVYERIGLFNTRYRFGADYDFVLKCLGANVPWIILDDILVRMRADGKGTTFNFDDWTIRRSYRLSSVVSESLTCTNSFIRYVSRTIILKIFGGKTLSAFRSYLWRKRIYR